MKAYVYKHYGQVDGNFVLTKLPKPVPADDQVLIKVRAVSINRVDWYRLIGRPKLVIISAGIFKPRKSIQTLGADVSGVVEDVGNKVTEFKTGDEVYGEIFVGSFAEYATANTRHIAIKPKGLSFEQAAAVPLAALTALQAIHDHGKVKKGQQVLINGASGGVGHFAVQMAKSYGAEVTAVCGTESIEMVRALGADHVVDYKKNKVAEEKRFDVVIDAVGNLLTSDYEHLLAPGGKGVLVGFKSFRHMLSVKLGSKRKSISLLVAKSNTKDLDYLRDLLDAGVVKPVIDKQYAFAELPAALKYFMRGRTKGKVVARL